MRTSLRRVAILGGVRIPLARAKTPLTGSRATRTCYGGGEDLVFRFGAKPNYTSFEGYIAARVLVEGLRRAGKNSSREKFARGR